MEPPRDIPDGSNLPEPQKSRDAGVSRSRVVRRALFKPLNVLTLVAGLGLSFVTGIYWFVPLTLAVYTSIVYLAAKDPIFVESLQGKRRTRQNSLPSRDISPERRARWLSRGETREKVESALVTYRKAILAIEESDDVTLRVLEGAVPKLHEAANRMVDVAANRERAAGTLADFEGTSPSPEQEMTLNDLRKHVRAADQEIHNLSAQFMTLRVQVVRASMDSTGAKQQAEDINTSLDSLNYRLEALNETFSPGE